jgi:rhodanese-related sulfurtransferase
LIVSLCLNAQLLQPNAVPWFENRAETLQQAMEAQGVVDIQTAEAMALLTEGKAVFIDARESYDFDSGHIPGSLNIPAGVMDLEERLAGVPKDAVLVTYCSGVTCSLSHDLAELLTVYDFTRVKVFSAGLEGWSQAGGELEYQ